MMFVLALVWITLWFSDGGPAQEERTDQPSTAVQSEGDYHVRTGDANRGLLENVPGAFVPPTGGIDVEMAVFTPGSD
jgi:hypothetical protein